MKLRHSPDAGLLIEDGERWVALAAALDDTASEALRAASSGVLPFLAGGDAVREEAAAVLERVRGEDGVAADPATARLPFTPRSMRAYMLWESHVIASSRMLVKNFFPAPVWRAVSTFERVTGRPFPKLKPNQHFWDTPTFYVANHTMVLADGDPMWMPAHTRALDFELELACVLARPIADATPAEARAAVGGWLVLNDWSARDVQADDARHNVFGPVVKSKTFANSIGADVLTDDAVPDWRDMRGRVRVDGVLWCEGTTAGPAHDLGEMLAHASKGECLDAGDVISTGTMPGCCGLELDRWIQPGQTIELEIDGIGTVTNRLDPAAKPADGGAGGMSGAAGQADPLRADVLVVGLGPVGQLLALLLGAQGVDTIAVDAADEPYSLPRAATVDDEVLRIFQAAGVDAAVLADAQVQPAASFVTAHGRPTEVFRFSEGVQGHPPLVSIHQPSMERTMVAALGGRPSVRSLWGHRLVGLEQGDHAVTATVEGGDERKQVRARWIVGADGGRSAVRAALGIGFGGSTFEQRWVVADVKVDRPLAKVPHPHFVGDLARPTVTLPMSPGRHRWEWMLHPGEDAGPLMEPAAVDALIAPWLSDGEHAELERLIVYTFHARNADRWRDGRVLLAGDAAHVMPPFVGQGFSSGARDASNLAWKLGAVLGGAPAALLDTYEAERRPHVTAMQRLAVQWGGIVQTTKPRTARIRDGVTNALDRTGGWRWLDQRAKPLPAYGAGAFATKPHRLPWRRAVGSLFPQPPVTTPAGEAVRLDDLLGEGWALVSGGEASPPSDGLRTVQPGRDLLDTTGAITAWLGRHGADFALLRPDRFVFACGPAHELPAALAARDRLLGRTVSHHRLHRSHAPMVTRIGHIALRVADLDAAVAFQRDVVGMVETERVGRTAYLTCNERHHELILIEDPANRGYDHVGLEVGDADQLDRAAQHLARHGGEALGPVRTDPEPGVDRALTVRGPEGHVFKLYAGMADAATPPPPGGDRPERFEHVSFKARNPAGLERFLEHGLGLRFSDRMGPMASWWHCDADHHGVAIVRAPKAELSHYAVSWPDLNALGRVADRLRRHTGRRPVWGPSRHGPGNNHFLYVHDADGAMLENCSELARMEPAGAYTPRDWPLTPKSINLWGGRPPVRFLLTGYPIARTAA